MAIYGDMLGYFPELIAYMKMYPIKKNPNGIMDVDDTVTPRYQRMVIMDGAVGKTFGDKKNNSQAFRFDMENMLGETGGKQIWSTVNLDIYLPVDVPNGEICAWAVLDERVFTQNRIYYMITGTLGWYTEGGFYRYKLELLGGSKNVNNANNSTGGYGRFLS